MEKINYCFEAIKNDNELKKLILESAYSQKDYKPRKKRGGSFVNSKSGIAARNFWNSSDGNRFRGLFEHKYGKTPQGLFTALHLFIAGTSKFTNEEMK